MKGKIDWNGKEVEIDFSEPLDISIAVGPRGPRAWYVDPVKIKPVINQHFRGSVALGGSVNFNDVFFNPHGHATHTENVGHIAKDIPPIHQTLTSTFFKAQLISVTPIKANQNVGVTQSGDLLITAEQLKVEFGPIAPEALIIRTLPNDHSKKSKVYSDTNFPYIEEPAMRYLAELGVKHLLVDLPSVDRESDGGLLLGHRAFWCFPQNTRMEATITEMVYVDNKIEDGHYLLNLQVAAFENDAAPSRPLLYAIG